LGEWNTFVEVEGVSGAQEDALNADMPEEASVVIPVTVIFTDAGKVKAKAI
jgi:hypothetical protein